MSLALLGMGGAVPGTVYDQAEGLFIAKALCCRTQEQVTWLPTMYDGTGIRKRHMVLPRALVDDVLQGTRDSRSIYLPTGEVKDRGPSTGQRMETYRQEAGRLAQVASAKALRDCAADPAKLTHLVTVSCTGFGAPGFDQELIQALGLSRDIARTHVGFMGCHGALNGLRVAGAFADADPEARVLLCAVELCSVHYHYGWDPGKVVANAIFADGAAALVGGHEKAAPRTAWRLVASGGHIVPDTQEAMSWIIGDHGFEMTLSKKVPGLIYKHLRPWLIDWLGRHGRRLEEIRSWAIHPGGPRILGAAEEALGLRSEQTATARAIFAEFGNISSPTILFILERMRRENGPRPCLALGFGPGLAIEAALFE